MEPSHLDEMRRMFSSRRSMLVNPEHSWDGRAWCICAFFVIPLSIVLVGTHTTAADDTIRICTYNVSLQRDESGKLLDDLKSNSLQARQIAEVVQRVAPDLLLLNEFDFDASGEAMELFVREYLGKSQAAGLLPLRFPHRLALPVNTGVASGLDLNQDGKAELPMDAWGFGHHPGQYGMLVLSRLSIDRERVRSFQKFLWHQMPGALEPAEDGQPYYPREQWKALRLSSKSHWDVPIRAGDQTIHFLVCHPTPPVFDGKEDRNGCRNHDEIRLWADYVTGGERAAYLRDDQGRMGGLKEGASFVIAGDLNADPNQGDSRQGAIHQLLQHPAVHAVAPKSSNGQSTTALFGSRRYRVDYVLPSKGLPLIGSGVFWPASDAPGAKAVAASDHRPVWIDIRLPRG